MIRSVVLLGALLAVLWPGCGSTPDEVGEPGRLSPAEAGALQETRDEARRLLAEGDMGAALDLLTRWEGSSRARSICFETAADMCLERSQPAMAVLYIDRALHGRPDDPDLLFRKGDALLRAGREEEAEIALRQCLSFDWNQHRAKIVLAELLLSAGHDQKANAYLDAVGDDHQWDVHSLLVLGAARSAAGRHEEALRHFDDAHRLAPDGAEPLFNRGKLLEETGDGPGAMAAYRKALEVVPDHVPSLFNLGCLLVGAGDRSEGEAFLDAACKSESNPVLRDKMEKTRTRLLARPSRVEE